MDKYKELKNFIKKHSGDGVIIAFSGGVDSSLLLRAAKDSCDRVLALTFETALSPTRDLDIARFMAREIGVEHRVLKLDEFENKELLENPINRCYICKKYLFQKLKDYASEHGYARVFDGTNLDDMDQYRPGLLALQELGIISPLRELGLRKADVRRLAGQLGISVSKRPSAPCMATRLPYNTRLDRGLLERIGQGEDYLRSLGFSVFRLRVHGNVARLELEQGDFRRLLDNKTLIVNKLKGLGFDYITLDLEGFRSGSMDINLGEEDGS